MNRKIVLPMTGDLDNPRIIAPKQGSNERFMKKRRKQTLIALIYIGLCAKI